jgi:hypothetical protein
MKLLRGNLDAGKGMLVIETRFEQSEVLRRSLAPAGWHFAPSSTVAGGLGIKHIFASLLLCS